jgi:hypothetical protein
VPKADIEGNGYDLSINRYKEVVHAVSEHLPPKEILAKLAVLEAEIQAGMKELEGMLAIQRQARRIKIGVKNGKFCQSSKNACGIKKRINLARR